MKVLEWQHHFSHCQSLVIIPDAQGQLNPQFQVTAGQSFYACPHNLQESRRCNQKRKGYSGHNFKHQFSDAQVQVTP